MKTKPTLKFTLYGLKIKNIEFFQTFILHFRIKYLEWKILKTNVLQYYQKLLKFK